MAVTIDRRTMLRSAGATIALPLLEAMVSGRASAAAAPNIPPRMAVFYFGTGMNMREFTPVDEGPNFTLSRVLKPLETFRRQMTVLSGTWLRHGGGHGGDYTFLTGAKAHTPGGIKNTISADQVAAEHVGRHTRFPSLELSISRGTGLGSSLKTLAWNRHGVPLTAESDPQAIFDRLFRAEDRSQSARRRRELEGRGSILDAIGEQARRLQRRISRDDGQRLAEYLQSVRQVEQQLQRDVAWSERPRPSVAASSAGDLRRPYDPERTRDFHYETYARLMYDLVTLALQTDSTRVITYVVRRELRGGVYPEFGVSKGYHELSHHHNDPKNLDELTRVDTIYMRHWAYVLERLKSIRQVDGTTLLDYTMLAFSSGMGINHSPDRLPTALFGGGALGIKHQGHLQLPERTPLAALWHTMLDRMEVPPSKLGEPFQDSSGPIPELIG
jgi:hypothetical protein